jgi:hypothetical protein
MTKKLMSKKQIRLPRSVKKLFPNVTSAYDSTKSVDISVSPKDCKEAQKLNPSECALARAARRELHADAVIIGMSSSYIIKDNQAIRFATPESVSREIISFDRHQDFAPGDYHLMPKSPSNRFGKVYRKKEGGKDKSAKRKVYHRSARVRILAMGSEGKND